MDPSKYFTTLFLFDPFYFVVLFLLLFLLLVIIIIIVIFIIIIVVIIIIITITIIIFLRYNSSMIFSNWDAKGRESQKNNSRP